MLLVNNLTVHCCNFFNSKMSKWFFSVQCYQFQVSIVGCCARCELMGWRQGWWAGDAPDLVMYQSHSRHCQGQGREGGKLEFGTNSSPSPRPGIRSPSASSNPQSRYGSSQGTYLNSTLNWVLLFLGYICEYKFRALILFKLKRLPKTYAIFLKKSI